MSSPPVMRQTTALLIEARGIERSYPLPDRSGLRPVLRGVDLRLSPGESVLISGVSGSGKTTLLSILGMLERASGGTMRLFGRDLAGLSSAEVTRLRRGIGFCFQSPQLLADMSARENALLPLVPRGMAVGQAADRVDDYLDAFDMQALARAPAQLLSGGEQQRVALVRALAALPEILLFDEPAAHLDDRARSVLTRLLQEALERGAALLLTSHEEYAKDWVQWHLYLEDGRLQPHDATHGQPSG